MFECNVCGHKEASEAHVSEVFDLGGRRVLVEGIPALVCKRCGEPTFSRETAEMVRQLTQGETLPLRTESLDVFSLV